mgnify:CR=1 FL=1
MAVDTVTGLELNVKRSVENYPFTFEFTSFHTGETIASVSSVTQAKRDEVVGSTDLIISSITHDDLLSGQCWLNGGTDGEFYCITMQVVTSIGAIRTCSGVLSIKDVC